MDTSGLPINLYQIIGLKDFASLPLVRAAYKKMSLRFHPDREGGSLERMKKINFAYEFITKNKINYDHFVNEKKYGKPPPSRRYTFSINPGWARYWTGESSDVWTGRTETSSQGY